MTPKYTVPNTIRVLSEGSLPVLMLRLLQQNKIFFSVYTVALTISAALFVTQPKGQEILFLNDLHNPFFDFVFKYTTRLAELPLFIFILVVVIRFSFGMGFVLLTNCSLTFLIIQLLKKVVFESHVRPALFFSGSVELNFVQGIQTAYYHSFPSGHTAGAFALFTMMAFFVKDKRWGALFIFLSLMVGLSRMYLLQHFLVDVMAGSAIGVAVSIIFYLTFVRSAYYQNLSWKDKSLI